MFIACVDRRGVIEFLPDAEVDDELIAFAGHSDLQALKEAVSAVARHAHDGTTLLVPGVPEAADDDEAAVDAVIAWRNWSFDGELRNDGVMVLS